MKIVWIPIILAFTFNTSSISADTKLDITKESLIPQPIKRDVKSHQAFQHIHLSSHHKHTLGKNISKDKNRYQKHRHPLNARGRRGSYRYPIKSYRYRRVHPIWISAYPSHSAPFYDNQGFFYGYFNHQGFYLENIFYRYDRYYTYRDRVRGRGLFDHRYYIPLHINPYRPYRNQRYERGYRY